MQMLAPKNNMKGMQLQNQKSLRAQERTGHADLCHNEKPSFQIARKEALLLLGVYLSAIVHDYDHRGVTNAFLVQDEDLLALTFNDLSPMENHHVSAAFLLMKKSPNNFLDCLPRLERDQLRDQVVQMVLGTDMKQHFSTCSIFTSKIVTKCIATAAPVLQLVDESTRNVCASGQDVFMLRQNSTSRPRRAFSELRQVRLSQSCRIRSLDPYLSISLSDCQPLTGRNVPATENQHLNMRPALTSQPTLLINSNRVASGPDGPHPAPATIEHHLPTLHRLSNIPCDETAEQRDELEHLCHAVETPLLNHASPTDSSIEPNAISLSSSSPALTSAVNSTAAALDVQHKPFSTTSVTDEETVHQASSSNLKSPFCEADCSVEARPASLPGVVLHSQPTINRSSATLTKEKMKSSSGSDREGSSVMAAGTQQAALDLDDEDAMLLWKVALKCADLGHLASKEAVHVRWVHLLEEELFRQGDLERERGYSVSPLMDRTKAGITNSQPGFFNIIVLPLFASFTEALPSVKPLLDQVRKNYDMWSSASGPSTS
ncbi:hypothetical protein CEUSTIGMA_g5696.t1 [Chlamydomonas eustigma]|uniref:Phosphodiesterase n=1 Tax=Chlamydomonas eustigma TaxID=1157962 RepID=A0A250X591_9CHLO|nr:hypothetical protein CEUSTIGMA_g5696.t1 [Chlamydomonas eustigma]|eukprot:GAX78254.1 hypothetical protein CEUSTIGMA_g5696.t1 [Chlamydomonas eustigma]